MSNDWLIGKETNDSRILAAVNGDEILAERIIDALDDNIVERVPSKVAGEQAEERARENVFYVADTFTDFQDKLYDS